jgi:hypothetical protein
MKAFLFRTVVLAQRLLLISLPATALLLGAGHGSARAQSQGIQVVGATNTSPLALTHGCNAVTIQSPNGTRLADVAALVKPAAALQSIWRYSNPLRHYEVGYFADPKAPVTFSTTGTGSFGTATESYFLCVNQAATIISI